MNKIYILQKDELGDELYDRIYLLIRKTGWTRQSMGATFGLAGGMLSIILGLLWAVVRYLAPVSLGSLLNVLSNVFFMLSLPLLALGAYCLDLLEKRLPILPLPAESQSADSERWHGLRTQHPHNN